MRQYHRIKFFHLHIAYGFQAISRLLDAETGIGQGQPEQHSEVVVVFELPLVLTKEASAESFQFFGADAAASWARAASGRRAAKARERLMDLIMAGL